MKLTVKDTKGKDQGEVEVKFPLVEAYCTVMLCMPETLNAVVSVA